MRCVPIAVLSLWRLQLPAGDGIPGGRKGRAQEAGALAGGPAKGDRPAGLGALEPDGRGRRGGAVLVYHSATCQRIVGRAGRTFYRPRFSQLPRGTCPSAGPRWLFLGGKPFTINRFTAFSLAVS